MSYAFCSLASRPTPTRLNTGPLKGSASALPSSINVNVPARRLLPSPLRKNPLLSARHHTASRATSSTTPTARRDRVDPNDEAFVTCDHCGTDVIISATKIIDKGSTRVKCPQCSMQWYPTPENALTDDGTPLLKALEQKRQQLRQTANRPSSDTPDAAKPPPAPVDESNASVRLYIAGLGPKVDADALRAALEVYGKVTDVNVVVDRVSGRSKGFGFATVVGTSAASAAIDDLSGSSMLGRRLTVRKAYA